MLETFKKEHVSAKNLLAGELANVISAPQRQNPPQIQKNLTCRTVFPIERRGATKGFLGHASLFEFFRRQITSSLVTRNSQLWRTKDSGNVGV